ncbi:MAG: glucuronide permease [Proteobacteria bacterium]|nr:glucuronide permease [Pseudomonadota bacterium]
MMKETSTTRYNRAKIWQVAFFSMNNSATNAQFFIFTMWFMVYCTENLLLGAALVGIMMTSSRLFDAVTDPIIGLLIDKTNTRFGKFRPFMVVGSLILNLTLFVIFSGIKFETEFATIVFLGIFYVFWVVGYTFQCTVTKSAQVILTNDPKQRPLFGGFDAFFTIGVAMVFMAGALPILDAFGGVKSAAAWKVLALVAIGLNVFFTFLAVIGIWSKDNPKFYSAKKTAALPKFKDYLPIIKGNRALQMLIVAASTNKLAQTVTGAATFYFFMYVIRNIDLQPKLTAIGVAASVAGTVLGVVMAIKMGKKETFTIGSWGCILIGLLMIIVRPFDPAQLVLLIVFFCLSTAIGAVTNQNVIPMIADAADYENWRSGRFVPGMIGTAFSFIDKVISSLSTSIVGIALGWIGYKSGMEPNATLYWTIMSLYIGIPVFGHICSVIAMKWHPIDRTLYDKMVTEINQRDRTTAAT